MTRRALVTRPEEDAAPLAAALAARGIDVALEPLLAIEPLADAALDLAGVQALLFTSANGVRAFVQLARDRNLGGWPDIPVLTVGDASAAAAQAAGFTRVESAGGDVEALARLAIERLDPKAGPLFHAAGSAVAGDLAGRLGEAGFELRRTVLYEAKPAAQLSPATVTDLANGAFDLALFFSPRTAATFVGLARSEGEGVVAGCRQTTALCLSPAVAAAAQELPWRAVASAARPDLPSILELVDRWRAENEPASAPPVIDATASTSTIAEPETAPMGEPIVPDAARPAASSARNRFITTAAIAAVVAAVIALGAEALRPSGSSAPVPGATAPDAATTARFDALEERLGTIESTIATTKTAVEGLTAETAAVKRDVAALQSATPAPSADVTGLTERLATLEQKLADLQARPAPEATAAPAEGAALAQLTAENAALRNDLAALKTQLTSLGSLAQRVDALDKAQAEESKATGAAAVTLAASQLGGALATGRPFNAELKALTDVAAADSELAAKLAEITAPLVPLADKGVPTLVDLKGRFPAIARSVADAESQEALASAAGSPEAGGWFDRLLGRLSSTITVRPVGNVEGERPVARVARAETRLNADDLAGAVSELKGLAGTPGAAAAEWLAAAEARLAADQAAVALQTAAAARLNRSAATSDG
jgi:uroporphyrinogen-III synthase